MFHKIDSCFKNIVLCFENCLLCLQIWATVKYTYIHLMRKRILKKRKTYLSYRQGTLRATVMPSSQYNDYLISQVQVQVHLFHSIYTKTTIHINEWKIHSKNNHRENNCGIFVVVKACHFHLCHLVIRQLTALKCVCIHLTRILKKNK